MRVAWTCVCIALLTAGAGAQIPNAQVVRVGFPTAMTAGSGAVIREGRWTPVLTELQMPGRGIFEGALRVISEDLDGDLAEFVSGPVILNPEAGLRRYWTYAIAFERRTPASNWTVDLLDAGGTVLLKTPAPPTEVLSNDDQLVLDISERPVSKLRSLHLSAELDPALDNATQRYLRKTVISFMPARDVPDRWIGLEAVDVLVWDQPNPAQISDGQLAAIIEWVRRGGQLVVGIGDTWPAIKGTPLESILPVQSDGNTVAVKRLRFFSERYVTEAAATGGAGPRSEGFASPIPVAHVQPLRDALVTFRDQSQPDGAVVNLATMRLVGAGRVIAFAASLRELSALPIHARFFSEFLELTPISAEFARKIVERQQGPLGLGTTRLELLSEIAAPISFSAQRSVFVLAVFAFAAAYFLLATAGSWWWLKKHRMTGLSWSVFAAFAVVAGLLSLGAVSITGGIRQGAESMQVVDLVGGQRNGTAFAWVGYGSALRTQSRFGLGSATTDLLAGADAGSMESPASFLRGFPVTGPTISTYATPARYRVDPAAGEAADVLVRATLKQFEGAWRGPVDGTMMGQLVADRATGRLLESSWIQNDLPADTRGGYLLYLDPRSRGGSFDQLDRAGGPAEHWRGGSQWPAAMHVLATYVPPLKAGERTRAGFAQREYDELALAIARWQAQKNDPSPDETSPERPDLTTLWHLQQYWAGGVRGLPSWIPDARIDRRSAALLLASTASLYYPSGSLDSMDTVGQLITLDGLADIDVMQSLIRGQALLLAWTEAAGPVALMRDGSPVRSRVGYTLYRVRLPIQLTGEPPARLRAPEKKEAGATE
jgi:hypothetical protein